MRAVYTDQVDSCSDWRCLESLFVYASSTLRSVNINSQRHHQQDERTVTATKRVMSSRQFVCLFVI